MTSPLNPGERLSRGVAIVASVEPKASAQIRGDVLYYGTAEGYTVEQEVELTRLGWYKSDGSWAFYT